MDIPTLDTLSKRKDFVAFSESERVELVGFWKAGSPELNLNPGAPLYSNMATHEAESHALNLVRSEEIRKTSSLYEIIKNPDLYSEENLDRILSNHPTLRRRIAQPTKGYLAMIVPNEARVIVPRGAIFFRGDLQWVTEQTWIGKPKNLTETTDRLLTRLADGTWFWTFPVVASGTGEEYNIKAGTQVTWYGTRTHAISIYADSDFQEGVSGETIEEWAERLDSGLAAPGMAGRMNIEALIRQQFPFVRDVSQIGGGDVEMQRDGYNILGLKVGGKSDIYIRTAPEVSERKFELEGKKLSDGSIQLYVHRDVFPGFYTLLSVKKNTATDLDPTLTITGGSYGKDTNDLPYDDIPEMSVTDARFTRFQTLLVQFQDPDFDPDNPYYSVTLLGMPNIADIQDYISQRQVRDANNDVLIKAPIPMLTAVTATVEYIAGDLEVDVEACERTIKNVVNNTRFMVGKLSTTPIVHAVQDILPGNAQIKPSVDLLSRIIYPNGSTRAFTTTTELEVATVPDQFTSPRTVAYYAQSVRVSTKLVKRLQV